MDVSIKQLKRVDVVKVTGRVDSNSAPDLERALKSLLGSDRHQIVLDLEDTDYLSSAGVRVLIATIKAARHANGDVHLAHPSERVLEVLRLAGLEGIFPMYPDVLEAVGSF